MKTKQNHTTLALEVKVADASYSGIGVDVCDANIISQRVVKHLSEENRHKLQYVSVPNKDLVAAPLEEVWHHILKSLQII